MKPEDFRMRAEWEPHEGTWLAWPHEKFYPGHQMKLERIWLEITAALHEHENVHIIVPDESRRDHVEHQLKFFDIGLDRIDFHEIETNDYWICDNGPLFVVDEEGKQAIVNWRFNGWGGRYPHDLDSQIALKVAKKLSLPVFEAPVVLETGFEVNGQGTLIITESSVLNPNRNPGLSKEQVEEQLKRFLGLKKVIWVPGMDGNDPEFGSEETDGHIDLQCRFVDESTVVYGWPDNVDEGSPFYKRVLKVTLDILENATTESGKPLTLIPMPMPKHPFYSTSHAGAVKHISATQRAMLAAPASGLGVYCAYLDWHVANDVVLAPIYGDENDLRAMSIIGEQFPGREVVGIDSRSLLEGGGIIHCVTKEQPL